MATFTGFAHWLTLTANAPGVWVTTALGAVTTPFVSGRLIGLLDPAVPSGAVVVTERPDGGAVDTVIAHRDVLTLAIPRVGYDDRPSPGLDRFERIHTRVEGASFGRTELRDLGNLLSGVTLQLEVWNAYRRANQTLLSITVSGPSGVSIADPYGVPIVYRAMQSRFYTVTVALVGPAIIDNVIVFDFDGIEEPPALLEGIRLLPFPFEPHWDAGLADGYSFLTDVFTAHDGSEQRRELRGYPRRIIELTPVLTTLREAAYLEALLYGWMGQPFGVPAWWDRMRLDASASIGGTSLTVSTTVDRDLIPGQAILVWEDPFTWEARVVDTVGPTTITLVDPLENDWAEGVWVLPLFVAGLDDRVTVDRHAKDATSGTFRFVSLPRVPV